MNQTLSLILRKNRIVLGNLPMLGISYQGTVKDKEYKERFRDKAEMKKVIRTALKYGVRFFAASHRAFNQLAPTYLEAVSEVEAENETALWLIPCIDVPLRFRNNKIDDYRRWKTHLEYETKKYRRQILQRYLEDPILNCRQGWKEGLVEAKPYEHDELKKEMEIDWKIWEETITEFRDYNVAWVEPGSGTDFLAISRIDLLNELLDATRKMGHRVLLGSHHVGATHELITTRLLNGFEGFVTPINKLGAMMFPTQKQAEKAIKDAKKQGKLVVAIKPFAGGRIPPEEASSYVFKEVEADACMIGVGSEAEAMNDFQIAEEVLASLPSQGQ